MSVDGNPLYDFLLEKVLQFGKLCQMINSLRQTVNKKGLQTQVSLFVDFLIICIDEVQEHIASRCKNALHYIK